jgi:hypothetical protein
MTASIEISAFPRRCEKIIKKFSWSVQNCQPLSRPSDWPAGGCVAWLFVTPGGAAVSILFGNVFYALAACLLAGFHVLAPRLDQGES